MTKTRTNPTLSAFADLVGKWTMESPQYPGFRGRSDIAWIENGDYLLVRDEVDAGEFPAGTWIVSGDDSSEECTSLYHDSRGVSRVYQMSLVGGVWKIWRLSPGFNQRFVGRLGRGSKTIKGHWDTSGDGTQWEKDFDLVYRRAE